MMLRRLSSLLSILCLSACSDDPVVEADSNIAAESSGDTVNDSSLDGATDGELDLDVPVTYECGTESPEELAACVDGDLWWTDMEAIEGPRVRGTENWQRAQDLCADRLAELGYEVERQDWGAGVNVIGVRAGTERPDEFVVVGGHYDSTTHIVDGGGYCPGADDNASSVAGALEVARVLATTEHERSTVIACWDFEEGGLLGSRAHATRAAADGDVIAVVFALEMIAFASSEPDSQVLPDGFALFFPETVDALNARDWRGDFIAAIGDVNAQEAMDALARIGATTGVDSIAVPVPLEFRAAAALADLRRSDHAPFWDANYPAIMLTDTANFRNPNYHCAEGIDSLDTLDREFAAGTIANTIGAAAIMLASETLPPEGPQDPRACTLSGGGCEDGETCSATYANVVGLIETCVEDSGTRTLGDTCARSEFGVDDCTAGLICTRYDRPVVDDTAALWCMALCESASDCSEGQRCQTLGVSPYTGVCVTNCDPANPDTCPDNARCGVSSSVGSKEWGGLCAGARASGDIDAVCEVDADCGSGAGCSPDTGTCRPFCTDATPCTDGTCAAYDRPNSIPGLGFCHAN
jgi:hypothetical protein